MKCLKCGNVNPGFAEKCGCGEDLRKIPIKNQNLDFSNVSEYKTASKFHLTLGWIFALLGGLLGIAIGYDIAYGRKKNNKNEYAYDYYSREKAKWIFYVGLTIMTIGTIIRFSKYI